MDYEIKKRDERRARLFAGGTFFRARDVGTHGNKISIVAFEYAPRKAKLIVTNHNTDETNIVGSGVTLIDQNLDWNEEYSFHWSGSSTPTARKYSISWQISGGIRETFELGGIGFSQLFNVPSKLSVKMPDLPPETTPAMSVTIKPRRRVYDLEWLEPSLVVGRYRRAGGYSISSLRAALQSDPWIEMLPRTTDVNDEVNDDSTFSMFEDTYLRGGDGLPSSPVGFEVAPTPGYLILLNEGEASNGELQELNQMYTWDNNKWIPYVPPPPEPV